MAGKLPLAEAVEDAALMEVDLRPIVMGLKKRIQGYSMLIVLF